ncbi:MAG: hypothetical protein CM15mP102_20860 [Flavobacteriales bacterium]|nr:MAG: hypothetical protein CM15mP102_20860 [Flavobacteriales bacterium]
MEKSKNYKTSNSIELKWLMNSYSQIDDKSRFFRSDFDKLSGSSMLKNKLLRESVKRNKKFLEEGS